MPEIRIDPLTGLRSIIGGPNGRVEAPSAVSGLDAAEDVYSAGHEDRTPAELYAVRPAGGAADSPGWTVRVVPEETPALSDASPPTAPEANQDLFWAGPALGAHELILSAPDAVGSLSELTAEQVVAAAEVWRERMRVHADAACLHLAVDEGMAAAPAHTHAQLYALEFVPTAIARERERFSAYATRTMGGNLLGDFVQEEVRRRERIVAIDDECVLMSAFGARVPFQLMIAPRRPRARFEDDGPTGARMLHAALRRLAARFDAPPPVSLWVRTAPRGAEQFCWRVDILPRLTIPRGLELGTGVYVNPVPPERAAAELRDA